MRDGLVFRKCQIGAEVMLAAKLILLPAEIVAIEEKIHFFGIDARRCPRLRGRGG